MGSARRGFSLLLVAILATSSFFVFFNTPLGLAQNGTNESGIINSNSTWKKENSPYTLTGSLLINGVKLTIEPGVNVNLNGYYIQVNGSLYAKGSSQDRIEFTNGDIKLYKGWNPQENSVIENSILSGVETEIWGISPTISHNSIDNIRIYEGSPVISDNIIFGSSNTPAISGGSPIIFNNDIKGSIAVSDYAVVFNNSIEGKDQGFGVSVGAYGFVSNNIISGFEAGVRGYAELVIEKNLIVNNGYGVKMHLNANPTIRYNTIANNSNGIFLPGYSSSDKVRYHNIQVNYNNFENNGFDIYLGFVEGPAIDDVNATYNWWGTTDSNIISQKIHDNKNDFNLGKVTYSPLLTEPYSDAMPNPNASPPTSIPTLSPKPSSLPSTPTPASIATPTSTTLDRTLGLFSVPLSTLFAVVAVFLAIIAILSFLLYRRRGKTRNNSK